MAGVPPGLQGAVLSILRGSPQPLRRRELLGELERHGHRISLAGLNRILQYCAEAGLILEGPEGVRLNRTGGT
ncbi:MAG TPA: hypothetical protein VMI55_00880 [Thermoplasmata archaeon]|nr:hypothetical protein [Thermoplasmata archaeon]